MRLSSDWYHDEAGNAGIRESGSDAPKRARGLKGLRADGWRCTVRGRKGKEMGTETLMTPRQAAEKLGMSYPAMKHWILTGRIRTVKTPGGHHRVPAEALEEFLPARIAQMGPAQISGRNQLVGTVASLTVDGLLAKVVIAVGSQRVTAIITSDAVRELDLKVGDAAIALIKATEVMVGKPGR